LKSSKFSDGGSIYDRIIYFPYQNVFGVMRRRSAKLPTQNAWHDVFFETLDEAISWRERGAL